MQRLTCIRAEIAILIAVPALLSGETFAKTKGSSDGKVLQAIEAAFELYAETHGGHVATNWSDLQQVHDFTPESVLLSESRLRPTVVEQEYAILPQPVNVTEGRRVIALERTAARDSDGNVMRRYVWQSGTNFGSSTVPDTVLNQKISGNVSIQLDATAIDRALVKLRPQLAKAEDEHRRDNIERFYVFRNRLLSFLSGGNVRIANDGTLTWSTGAVLVELSVSLAFSGLVVYGGI